MKLKVGYVVSVFEWRLWQKNGGDSKTDNFMRKATITEISPDYKTATVIFDYNKKVSQGHCISDMIFISKGLKTV